MSDDCVHYWRSTEQRLRDAGGLLMEMFQCMRCGDARPMPVVYGPDSSDSWTFNSVKRRRTRRQSKMRPLPR